MPHSNKPRKPEPSHKDSVIETDEDIQRALKESAAALVQPVIWSSKWLETVLPPAAGVSPATAAATPPTPIAPATPATGVTPHVPKAATRPVAKSTAVLHRPTIRPPVAELTIFDDGQTVGETIRIRSNRFIIGRTEGNLLIPHDDLISTRHVEITRQQFEGGYRWIITDLQSTNGLFIRVSRTALADGSEILVGSGRYRFDAPEGNPVETIDHLPAAPLASYTTRGWDEWSPLSKPPALTELVRGGIGNRILLTRAEYWIGTDRDCDLCRLGDPLCELKHVRVSRHPKGGWQAEHNKSLNGLWYRVAHTPVESTLLFLIGEQRFRLRV